MPDGQEKMKLAFSSMTSELNGAILSFGSLLVHLGFIMSEYLMGLAGTALWYAWYLLEYCNIANDNK